MSIHKDFNKKAFKEVGIQVFYEVEITDKNGNQISLIRKRSDSFVANFLRWLQLVFSYTAPGGYGEVSLYDTTPSARTIVLASPSPQGFFGTFSALVTIKDYGIVVGSSTTPVVIDDNKLISQILHGSTAGLLYYNTQTAEAVVLASPLAYFRAIRTFTNNSGGTVNVNEIGIVFSCKEKTTGTERFFLALRDVLPSPQSVPDGATLTVRYKIQTSMA